MRHTPDMEEVRREVARQIRDAIKELRCEPVKHKHPCDRDEVRAVVLRLADITYEFYAAPCGAEEPNPDEFIAKRDALVTRLESMLARKE